MELAFGIFDHMDRSNLPLAQFYENRLALVEVYDRLGFHAYHVAEHHATPLGLAPSPNVYLAAIAQRTRRLRFGPLVYTLPLYHPIRLIEEICMLDQMSGGRLQLGVGKGISPIETAYYGIDPKHSAEKFGEALQLILNGLQSRSLTHEGRYYRFKDVPIELEPVQRPHPPLWYGIGTPDSAERAARQGMNAVSNAPTAGVRKLFDRYWASYQSPARRPLLGINRHIVVADTDEAALSVARRAYRQWHESFMKLWVQHAMPPVGVTYPTEFDGQMKDGRGIAGSPATVLEALREQLAETGANYLVGRFAFGDMALAEAMRSVELFAEHVMPALRAERRAAAE